MARCLFNEAGDALIIVDPTSERIVEVNEMTIRLTRLPREALLRQSIRSLLAHEQGHDSWLEAARSSGIFHGRDGFLLRTDRPDVTLPVSISVSRLHPGTGEVWALFTVRDRSEQVEAYRRVQRTESELRRVLTSVSDCLWSCRIDRTRQWRYRFLSPVVQRLTGRPANFFMEQPHAWEQVVDPEDLARWQEFRTRAESGQAQELEYRIVRADGSHGWVRECITIGLDDQGGLLLHGVLTDVTARKQAEQAAEDRQTLQTQKLESLVFLAGHLSHDFNNLITGILGHASLARLTCPPGSPVLHTLGQIEAIAVRAGDLCKQMLLCAGKGPVSVERRDLNALVRETGELLRPSCPPGVRLSFDLAPGLPFIPVDVAQVRQLVMNLLLNAFDVLSGQQGEIRVATHLLDCRSGIRDQGFEEGGRSASSINLQSLIRNPQSEEMLALEVCDSGAGMTPEIQARIFEPFFTTRPGRRGLGLSAVLGIVRSHQGAIRVESSPGKGTLFQVLFPAPPSPEPQPGFHPEKAVEPVARASAEKSTSWRGEGTVLVVDDEEVIRDVASRLLQVLGFQAILAREGEEAVARLQESGANIRLILLDLTMPRMGGEETFRQLIRVRPDIPIILMSGYPEPEVMGRFSETGLAAYLQKPFRLPALVEVIRRVLQ
jgi:PAS domain S-box-containing protein